MSDLVPPPSPQAPGRRWADRAARAGWSLLRGLYLGTALLGLLVTPPAVVLLAVPVLTGSAVVLLAGFVWYVQEHWPARRTVTRAATASAALIPFWHAVQALQSLGSAISLVVLGLLTVVTVHWTMLPPDDATRASPASGAGAGPSLRELLRVVPLETLLDEWRALQPCPEEQPPRPRPDAAGAARAALLDELQRRDPVAFAAWLTDGAAAPPDLYLRSDRGLST